MTSGIRIGDFVIPRYSISGDGVCRYLTTSSMVIDRFGEKYYPDLVLGKKIISLSKRICALNRVNWHLAVNYSIDTIFAEFAYLEEITTMNCRVIEMETAAAFKAAKLWGIAIGAIFCVSGNVIMNKTLYFGRTQDDIIYKDEVRKKIFPEIIDALL